MTNEQLQNRIRILERDLSEQVEANQQMNETCHRFAATAARSAAFINSLTDRLLFYQAFYNREKMGIVDVPIDPGGKLPGTMEWLETMTEAFSLLRAGKSIDPSLLSKVCDAMGAIERAAAAIERTKLDRGIAATMLLPIPNAAHIGVIMSRDGAPCYQLLAQRIIDLSENH